MRPDISKVLRVMGHYFLKLDLPYDIGSKTRFSMRHRFLKLDSGITPRNQYPGPRSAVSPALRIREPAVL